MTEVVSRLWGWDRAKSEESDLKALVYVEHDNQHDMAVERRVFEAYGIPADDLVVVHGAVTIDSLISAVPMWHNAEPHYVHPGMSAVWDRLTAGLVDATMPAHDRIFVSRGRRLRRRTCRNIDHVEQYFADHGFVVVFPEELPIGQQAALFAGASVIAGFGGSAMFNILHARRLETLILLNHESYTARNEHLFTPSSVRMFTTSGRRPICAIRRQDGRRRRSTRTGSSTSIAIGQRSTISSPACEPCTAHTPPAAARGRAPHAAGRAAAGPWEGQ